MDEYREPRPKRGWMYALVGGGVVVVILAIVGAVIVAQRFVTERHGTIPELLGANTILYATITPALSDVPAIARLRSAYPELFLDTEQSELNERLQTEMGVTFEADIQPWLGAEAAFAAGGLSDISTIPDQDIKGWAKDATTMIILASTNQASAQAFLDKQRIFRTDQGEQFEETLYQDIRVYRRSDTTNESNDPYWAFALLDGHVVFASKAAAITTMIDNQANPNNSLAMSPRFVRLKEQLPTTALGYVYMDGSVIAGLLLAGMDDSLDGLSHAQADLVQEHMENVHAIEAIGISLTVLNEGFQFDMTTTIDAAALNEDAQQHLTASHGVVSPERPATIRDDALALMTFRLSPEIGNLILDHLLAEPNGAQLLAEWEDEYDIDLETDILSWMTGDGALVLLPPSSVGMITIPSFYFSVAPPERSAAERGVAAVARAIEREGGMAFVPEDIHGSSWQVVKIPGDSSVVGGYGFVGDDLVLGFGSMAVEASSSGANRPISSDPSFQTVIQHMPSPIMGISFLDMRDIMKTLRDNRLDGDLGREMQTTLDPIDAIGTAVQPMDEHDVVRGRLVVILRESRADI